MAGRVAKGFAARLEAALDKRLPGKVYYFNKWDQKQRGIGWRRKKNPVALMAHHTAGAATSSTRAFHPGNQRGANRGVINYVQHHYTVPAANFTLDRDGTVYVHCAFPVWHAGRGSFKGVKRFARLNIPDDQANDFLAGVEVVSKGQRRDWTRAQKESWGALANAVKEAAGWKGFYMRLPNHRTWAPRRKVDSRYSLRALRAWASKYGVVS